MQAETARAQDASPTALPTEATVMVRGLLKPLHEATLSSEVLAKVTEIPFTEGKRFKKGDVLVRFDCARYKAELAATQAEFSARKKTSDNNAELSYMDSSPIASQDFSKMMFQQRSRLPPYIRPLGEGDY